MKKPTWPEILFMFKSGGHNGGLGYYSDQKKALLTGVGMEVD